MVEDRDLAERAAVGWGREGMGYLAREALEGAVMEAAGWDRMAAGVGWSRPI